MFNFQKLKKVLSEKFSSKISERELEDCFTIVKDQVNHLKVCS